MHPLTLRTRLGTLALFAALALLGLSTTAQAQSAQDITHLFSVTQSAPVLDRVNRVYYSYVNLTNTSGATVEGQMRLVVTDSTLPVSNLPAPPDGTTDDGKPFYWLGAGDVTLAPGASSGNLRVNFELQRVRLEYAVRVEVMAEGGTVEVTGLTATPGANTIRLTWNAAPGATSYRVYWETEDAVTTGSEYGETTDTAFLHTGVLQGWTYYYRVAAVNAAGEGPLSPTVFASPALDQPDYTDPTTGMEFVYVLPGTFEMGDTFGDGGYGERPVHTVTLTQGYYIGKTEVTQAQWQAVMGSNPSYFQPSLGYTDCPTCPVENVSWNDIQDFVANLNAQTGLTYRLPTEAEWEYAAKGGPYSHHEYEYAGSYDWDDVAWTWEGEQLPVYGTHPAGTKLPNELGLYDMSGNVWEWVQDWWSYYTVGAQTDPTGPATGPDRVIRGGSWSDVAFYARVSSRRDWWHDFRDNYVGFRLALSQ